MDATELGKLEVEANARLQMQLALQSRIALPEAERGVTGPHATFQPPVGRQCMMLQHKLLKVQDAATLRPLILECPACPAEWSHLNVIKALQLLKQYPPLPDPADWRGLKRRAGALLEEATVALRHVEGPCPPEMVKIPDIRNPTAEMHEVFFHPRTMGLLVFSLANLGGHQVLFQKASVFLQRWLDKPGGGEALEKHDIANIVLAYCRQPPEAGVASEAGLFKKLAQHFEAGIDCDPSSPSTYNTHLFSQVLSGLAKLSAFVRIQTSTVPPWSRRLAVRALRTAAQLLSSFRPKELSAVVYSFGQLGCSEECRPFLLSAVSNFSSREQVEKLHMQDTVVLAEHFCSFTDGIPDGSQQPPDSRPRLTPEVLSGHTELCTAVQQLLRTITDVAAERIAELRPMQLASILRTAARARITQESLWTAVLPYCAEQLRSVPGRQPWTPKEVTAVLSGIVAFYEQHRSYPHFLSSMQSGGDERLRAGFVDLVRAMGSSLPGRFDGLSAHDIAEMMRCLGVLAGGCPALRRKLHGSRLKLKEATVSALTSLSIEQLSLPVLGELVVALAKLNADLSGVQGLLPRIAAELKTITSESSLHGELLRVAPLLWAMAVQGAVMGRQPPLLKQGLSSAVLAFATVFGAAAMRALSAEEEQPDPGGPDLGEDAFTGGAMDAEAHAEGAEDRQSRAGSGLRAPLQATDVAPALWALAALARTEGGSVLHKSAQLAQLAEALGRAPEAWGALLAGCTPSEFADVLWALGRLGVSAGRPLQAAISAACEDADYWVAEMLQGHLFLGRLLWGAVVLLSAKPQEALATAARRIAARLPELAASKPDADAFVALLWALVALDAVDARALTSALADGLGVRPKAAGDGPIATRNPVGAWEWSLLWELLALAKPRVWPSPWRTTTQSAWDQESHMATKLMGHDVHQVLSSVLDGAGPEARYNQAVPWKQEAAAMQGSWHPLRGVSVDAFVLERRWCVELTSASESSVRHGPSDASQEAVSSATLRCGRERALKWRILCSHGWTVFCIPAAALRRDTGELREAVRQAWQAGDHPQVSPICLAGSGDGKDSKAHSSSEPAAPAKPLPSPDAPAPVPSVEAPKTPSEADRSAHSAADGTPTAAAPSAPAGAAVAAAAAPPARDPPARARGAPVKPEGTTSEEPAGCEAPAVSPGMAVAVADAALANGVSGHPPAALGVEASPHAGPGRPSAVTLGSPGGALCLQQQLQGAVAGDVHMAAIGLLAPLENCKTLRDLIMEEAQELPRNVDASPEQPKMRFRKRAEVPAAAYEQRRKAPAEGRDFRTSHETVPPDPPEPARPSQRAVPAPAPAEAQPASSRWRRPAAQGAQASDAPPGGASASARREEENGPPPDPRRPPPAAAGRASAGPDAGAPAAAGAAEGPQRNLVEVMLCHAAKKKRLRLQRSVTIDQLIKMYGHVVKGEGTVILTDSAGVEQGRNITVGMLEEDNLATGSLIKLELRLDDW